MESVPWKLQTLEIWNECDLDEEMRSLLEKWWKWIAYAVNKSCKELLLRKMDLQDTLQMFEQGMFPNLERLIFKTNYSVDRKKFELMKKLMPDLSIERQFL